SSSPVSRSKKDAVGDLLNESEAAARTLPLAEYASALNRLGLADLICRTCLPVSLSTSTIALLPVGPARYLLSGENTKASLPRKGKPVFRVRKVVPVTRSATIRSIRLLV